MIVSYVQPHTECDVVFCRYHCHHNVDFGATCRIRNQVLQKFDGFSGLVRDGKRRMWEFSTVKRRITPARDRVCTSPCRFAVRETPQIRPNPSAWRCHWVTTTPILKPVWEISKRGIFALWSPCLLGYTRPWRRGRVDEGAPLLRE